MALTYLHCTLLKHEYQKLINVNGFLLTKCLFCFLFVLVCIGHIV
ncbi:hypothetical protein PMAG_a0033 [Pseudoalteromonas mariniglutinosa NCIMB 1770]|nr:hypothetical protein [Pseudoalteromonas mariniglutinosa NCIMB 1770]